MSGGEAAEAAAEVGEPGGMSDRTAKVVLLVVAVGAMWGIVVVFPWVAYFVAGILACRGWDKAHAWRARRSEDVPADDDEGADEVDIVAVLQQLERSVLLTELRAETGLPDTKAVKALLSAADIPWKGVRTPAGNGPGVHKDDIPVVSPVADDPHEERCCCRSEANNNTNNDREEEPEEGLRVERIGASGMIVYDPSDTVRHHRVK